MATKNLTPVSVQEYCTNDPFGNFVSLPPTALDLDGKKVDLSHFYDEAVAVISDPVFILDMKDEDVKYYYYKKFSSHKALLIGVSGHEDHFIASRAHLNPESEQLSVLYRKAKQIH